MQLIIIPKYKVFSKLPIIYLTFLTNIKEKTKNAMLVSTAPIAKTVTLIISSFSMKNGVMTPPVNQAAATIFINSDRDLYWMEVNFMVGL